VIAHGSIHDSTKLVAKRNVSFYRAVLSPCVNSRL